MELIMKDEYPTLGETIYYVNNGRTKSSGDVQRKTRYEKIHKKRIRRILSEIRKTINNN